MAKVHSPVSAISMLSDLTALGQTTSITLPKKRYWKLICVGFAALFGISLSTYFMVTTDFERQAWSNTETSQTDGAPLQKVPRAPNPDKASRLNLRQDELTVVPVPPPVSKDATKAKSQKLVPKPMLKNKNTQNKAAPKFNQKVASDPKKSAKTQP